STRTMRSFKPIKSISSPYSPIFSQKSSKLNLMKVNLSSPKKFSRSSFPVTDARESMNKSKKYTDSEEFSDYDDIDEYDNEDFLESYVPSKSKNKNWDNDD